MDQSLTLRFNLCFSHDLILFQRDSSYFNGRIRYLLQSCSSTEVIINSNIMDAAPPHWRERGGVVWLIYFSQVIHLRKDKWKASWGSLYYFLPLTPEKSAWKKINRFENLNIEISKYETKIDALNRFIKQFFVLARIRRVSKRRPQVLKDTPHPTV